MKLEELFESVTFVPTFLNTETNHQETPYKVVDGPCELCDGTGEDYNDESLPCKQCGGKKTFKARKYAVPDLNVANGSAITILQMLGLAVEEDMHGTIDNKDLPDIKRQLLKLKNSSSSRAAHTYDGYEEQNKRTQIDKSGPVPRIVTTGPKIVHGGMSDERIMRYVDELLKLVDFAQKNNFNLSWY